MTEVSAASPKHAETCPWSVGFATCDCGLINLQSKEPTMPENRPAKWRKKPVVITAYELTDDNGGAVAQWCNGTLRGGDGGGSKGGSVIISTLEGNMLAEPGDYVIQGVKGEFYPCKPDIFEATYEPA